jgi:hypothetical protein
MCLPALFAQVIYDKGANIKRSPTSDCNAGKQETKIEEPKSGISILSLNGCSDDDESFLSSRNFVYCIKVKKGKDVFSINVKDIPKNDSLCAAIDIAMNVAVNPEAMPRHETVLCTYLPAVHRIIPITDTLFAVIGYARDRYNIYKNIMFFSCGKKLVLLKTLVFRNADACVPSKQNKYTGVTVFEVDPVLRTICLGEKINQVSYSTVFSRDNNYLYTRLNAITTSYMKTESTVRVVSMMWDVASPVEEIADDIYYIVNY